MSKDSMSPGKTLLVFVIVVGMVAVCIKVAGKSTTWSDRCKANPAASECRK